MRPKKNKPDKGFIKEVGLAAGADVRPKPAKFAWEKSVVEPKAQDFGTHRRIERQNNVKKSDSTLINEFRTYVKERQGK